MVGLVTRNADDLDDDTFDSVFFEVKDVTGRQTTPEPSAINMVSCHGDSSVEESLVPRTEDGTMATREQRYFDWGYVCPSADEYEADLLSLISDCVANNADVRIDDVGFPRPEYCYCDRCMDAFETSDFDDWHAWRRSVVTNFVERVSNRVAGRLYMTIYPDPYPGHLDRRAGIDLEAVSEYVDEFMVPLYDMAYETTYWLEVIASGFEDALSTPFSIELYAVDVDHDNLVHAAEVAGAYGRDVYFAYDTDAARNAAASLADAQ